MANYGTMEEFAKALDNAYKGLPDAVDTALRDNVPTLISSIKLRVSTTGQNADGGSFSTPYSRSHRYKRKKYGKGALGQQILHKGFFYQGTMWDNFRMIDFESTSDKIKATLGFVGSNLYLSNDRLNEIHSFNEGIKIAAPNKDESDDLTHKVGFAIGEYLKSAL